MDIFIDNFFNLDAAKDALPLLLNGLLYTLLLSLIVIPCGMAAGLLLALLYSSLSGKVRNLVLLWIDLFRSIPPLVLLVFVYYGLPFLDIHLPPLLAAAMAMTLNTSSYFGEIFRSGMSHVPVGQIEAARSTGLSKFQSLIYISTPQAFRNTLPDLIGNMVEVVKATSIASVVAIPELLRMARISQGITFNTTPLIMAAALYLLILLPAVRYLARFERKKLGER